MITWSKFAATIPLYHISTLVVHCQVERESSLRAEYRTSLAPPRMGDVMSI